MDKFQEKSEVVAAILAVVSAERKKIITMGLLLCVMGFMWSKVLSGKKQQQAIETRTTAAAKEKTIMSLAYITLPDVQGRNDRIKTDFFSPENFLGFNSSAGNRPNTASFQKDDNDIESIMKNISIDAILSGENPQVFINDQLLNIGDKLVVERSGKTYELELVKIMNDKIQLKYGEMVVETGIADSDNKK
jgi:hypothetical protein